MFYAYSIKQQDTVAAKNVTDLKETFRCLNKECDAEMFLKSSNGKRQPHFCAKPSKPHILGCIYGAIKSSYSDNDFIKMSPDNIFRGRSLSKQERNTVVHKTSRQHNGGSSSKKYIRTPISLLYFCLSHSLDYEYQNGLTVNDIILNETNLCDNANFEGIKGLRFVIGKTIRYDLIQNKIVIEIEKTTDHNHRVYLQADVFLSLTQLNEIKEYLLKTFDNRFKGHTIAVLGDWETDHKYHISCRVQSPKNVVYIFAHDI